MLNIKAILPYYISLIVLLIFTYLIVKYWHSIQKQPKYFKYTLLFLRSSVIILLLIILFNPLLVKNSEFIKNKKIVFFIDNSESLSFNKSDLIDKINYASDYFDKNNIEFEYYAFSDTFKKINDVSELTFDDKSTDFNQIFETSINNMDAEHYILISDGMQNEGMIRQINYSLNPINVFGVGNDSIVLEDLKFDSLSIKNGNDSIDIKCHFSLKVNHDYDNINIRISNDKYDNLNISNIDVQSGQNILLHDIKVEKDILSKHNIISIENIKSEVDNINNYLKLELDDKVLMKSKVLFISCYISDNTRFIKNILYDNKNIDFDHIIRIDDIANINDNYDMIIIDGYLNNEQLNIINNKNFKSSKFIYFQGPILSSKTFDVSDVLLNLGYNLTFVNLDSNSMYLDVIGNESISNGWAEKITPFNSNFFVTKNNLRKSIESVVDKKDHKKILLDYHKDSLFVFIPDLRSISNKTKRFTSLDYMSYLVDYYIDKIIQDNNTLNIYSDKDNFYINESIKIYLDINNKSYLKNYSTDLFIYNKNYNIISKIVEYDEMDNSIVSFSDAGKYYVEAVMELEDNIVIKSDKIEFNIVDRDKELYNIGLNEELLKRISFQTNGKYYDINDLSNYLNTINPSSSVILKLIRIKLFNFQFFWFIILLFLIVEWIIRKNRGLL